MSLVIALCLGVLVGTFGGLFVLALANTSRGCEQNRGALIAHAETKRHLS